MLGFRGGIRGRGDTGRVEGWPRLIGADLDPHLRAGSAAHGHQSLSSRERRVETHGYFERVDKRSRAALLFALGTSGAAAGIGSIGSRRAPQVYAQVDKPTWAPPAGVFGPVWTALYTAIGIAGWRLWTRGGSRGILGLHVTQLALNAAWPFTFFSARNRTAALMVIAALDATVAAEIVAAARRDRPTGALLAPYLAWSLFATALTAAVDPAGAPPASA